MELEPKNNNLRCEVQDALANAFINGIDEDYIRKKILTDDHYAYEVLQYLNGEQDDDEQVAKRAKRRNGRGFKASDAARFTKMAEDSAERGYLTPDELAVCRKPDKNGVSALGTYATQLSPVVRKPRQRCQIDLTGFIRVKGKQTI